MLALGKQETVQTVILAIPFGPSKSYILAALAFGVVLSVLSVMAVLSILAVLAEMPVLAVLDVLVR